MTFTDTQLLILTKLSQFGVLAFGIVSAVVAVGLAYLVFRVGWKMIKGTL